jgi:type IV pilus assembly protein PilM
VGALRFNANQGLPIAIDFGAGCLKVLQIAAGDPLTLVSAAAVETPEELIGDPARRIAFQLEVLPNLIKAGAFKGKRVICGIPAGHTIVKHIQTQRIPGVSVGETVTQALCVQLGCSQDSILVRHVEVGSASRAGAGAKTEVICIASTRQLVSGLLKSIKEAKLEPVGMHAEPLATLRAFDHLKAREDGAILYLDIGAHTTNLTIGHADHLVFARKIDFGGHAIDQAINKLTGEGLAKARYTRLGGRRDMYDGLSDVMSAVEPAQQRTAVMDPPTSGVSFGGVSVGEPLEILADEISMCLRYHSSLFPDTQISKVIFLGGESHHSGLCQFIARAVRLPGQTADPMARVARSGTEMVVGVDFLNPQPGWVVPLGLCLSPTDF